MGFVLKLEPKEIKTPSPFSKKQDLSLASCPHGPGLSAALSHVIELLTLQTYLF